ncbi:DUF6318 family protein [Pseudactinotalea sp.]|uniref:DUF6318 family protein n=1 Tax=Pseudactinotalea sp. TaxID=1926260 RepID=UPI003B3AA631
MNAHARRWPAAAASAATALTLAACDGDVEDPPTSTESTTEPTTEPSDDVTTEEPTPTATPPDVEEPEAPEEMLVDDAMGASAATWYFFELVDYARATGDTTRFEAMSEDDCGWCQSVVEQITSVYESGGTIEGADLTFNITDAGVELPTEERPYYAVIIRDAVDGPYVVRNADGTVAQEADSDPYGVLEVGLRYANGRFMVSGVDIDS